MDTKRFNLDTTLTLIAAYLGLFVGLIDANAINLTLPAIRDNLGGGMTAASVRKMDASTGVLPCRHAHSRQES